MSRDNRNVYSRRSDDSLVVRNALFFTFFDEEEDTKKHLSRGTWDITAFLLRRRRRQEDASVWSKGGEEVSS